MKNTFLISRKVHDYIPLDSVCDMQFKRSNEIAPPNINVCIKRIVCNITQQNSSETDLLL